MKLLQTIGVFIYLKLRELFKGILMLLIAVGVMICVSCIFIISGCITLGIWYKINSTTAIEFILKESPEIDNMILKIISASIPAGLLTLLCIVLFILLITVLPIFIKSNWRKAKEIVNKGK